MLNYDKAIGPNRGCKNEECHSILDRYQKNYCCYSCSNKNSGRVSWKNPERRQARSESLRMDNPMFNKEVCANHPMLQPWSEERKKEYSKFRKDHPEFHASRLEAAHSPEVRKRATETILKNNPNHFNDMSRVNNGGGFRSKIRARHRLDGMTPAEHYLYNYPGFKELEFEPFQVIETYNRRIYPDFLNPYKNIVLEIDGTWHDQEYIQRLDEKKEEELTVLGYTLIRSSNKQVFGYPCQIIEYLRSML